MPAQGAEKEVKAFLGTRPKARPKIEFRGYYGREMSASEREGACRQFERNIRDYEDEIGFLRIKQREIDAQIASIERAIAAMKAPLVRLKAIELREAVAGKPAPLSPEEQKNLFRALFEGLRQAARFVRRNARDIAEGLYDLTEAIATGTGSNHSVRVSRTIGELESRLADLRRERERIDAKRKEAMANIGIASAALAELGCGR
jgi:chromosome segregation ATPase